MNHEKTSQDRVGAVLRWWEGGQNRIGTMDLPRSIHKKGGQLEDIKCRWMHVQICPSLCEEAMIDPKDIKLPEVSSTWEVHYAKAPHRCPICNGTGLVHANFYNGSTLWDGASNMSCKSCAGSGIIWGVR